MGGKEKNTTIESPFEIWSNWVDGKAARRSWQKRKKREENKERSIRTTYMYQAKAKSTDGA